MTKDFKESTNVLKFIGTSKKVVRVTRTPRAAGWMKCNVDGASKRDGQVVRCGGVFRDALGRWVIGFTVNLGCMDPLSLKIYSIMKGLELAWAKGFRRVIIKFDSREAMDLVCGRK